MQHRAGAAGALDEECERELEQEEEQEEEVEQQVAFQKPASETDWNYEDIFEVDDPTSLAGAGVIGLRDVLQDLYHGEEQGLADIDSGGKVLLTKNFAVTLACAAGEEMNMDDYLRPVDLLLLFPVTGTVLLLSEREADAIVPLFWRRDRSAKSSSSQLAHSVVLVNLCFARDAKDSAGVQATLQCPPQDSRAMYSLSDQTLAAVQLFNGETTFGTPARRKALRDQVLASGKAKQAAQQLPGIRGQAFLLHYSHLEDIQLGGCRED